MSPENTQKLFDTFPDLYRDRNLSKHESSMAWGFEFGDGWFDIVWHLSQAIENEARSRGVQAQSKDWPRAIQVKQKAGFLIFHLAEDNDASNALIKQANLACQSVCEICGVPASPVANNRNYTRILCPDHAEKYLNRTLFKVKFE